MDDNMRDLVGKPKVETAGGPLTPPPPGFPDVYMPERSRGTHIEEAAGNDWFLSGEIYEVGNRLEMAVVRTNNMEIIPSAAIAELRESPILTPAEDSQYWEKLDDAPSFHTRGAPVEFGRWQSTAFALKGNPEVVILCHLVDVP